MAAPGTGGLLAQTGKRSATDWVTVAYKNTAEIDEAIENLTLALNS